MSNLYNTNRNKVINYIKQLDSKYINNSYINKNTQNIFNEQNNSNLILSWSFPPRTLNNTVLKKLYNYEINLRKNFISYFLKNNTNTALPANIITNSTNYNTYTQVMDNNLMQDYVNETINNTLIKSYVTTPINFIHVTTSFYAISQSIGGNIIVEVDTTLELPLSVNISNSGLVIYIINKHSDYINLYSKDSSLIYNYFFEPNGSNLFSIPPNAALQLIFIKTSTNNNVSWQVNFC
jgi:hypothetical protein